MKKTLFLAIGAISLSIFANSKSPELKLMEAPSESAKVVGSVTSHSPIELRLDKWVFVKNLETGQSGWALKAKLEKLTGQKFSFTSRYQFNQSEKMVENLEKHQKKMQKLIQTQQQLTKELFKQLDFDEKE